MMLAVPYRIVLAQAVMGIVLAAGLAPFARDEALAALLATAVAVGPNAYFGWRAQSERSAARLLSQAVGKQVATAGLLALSFAVARPAPLGFFAAFVLSQVMQALGAHWVGLRELRPGRRSEEQRERPPRRPSFMRRDTSDQTRTTK